MKEVPGGVTFLASRLEQLLSGSFRNHYYGVVSLFESLFKCIEKSFFAIEIEGDLASAQS
ncbi:MAG: hypothetical protein R2758_17195 [Bacteroidales bacterium]